MSFTLPVDRLSETSTLLAFRHPHPTYPLHILLVPKKPIATLSELDPAADGDFLADLYATALEQLEPQAVARVRARMCNPLSEEAQRDAAAALAVCERLSMDY